MKRRALEELLVIAHDLKHIKKFALNEAKARSKKRCLFRDIVKRVDRLYTEELLRTRKEDEA